MLSKFFPNNEHIVERVIRVVVGLGVLSLAFIGPQTMWGYLGLVPLATGLVGTCPIYTMFGVSTCNVRKGGTTAKPI
jgi:Protein of unknown function (DUF2892)